MSDIVDKAKADPALVSTLKLAAAEWTTLILFGMLTLDGGRMSKVTLIVAFAYTVAVALFVARRGTQRPSWLQRASLLFAPVPLLIAAYWLAVTLAGG